MPHAGMSRPTAGDRGQFILAECYDIVMNGAGNTLIHRDAGIAEHIHGVGTKLSGYDRVDLLLDHLLGCGDASSAGSGLGCVIQREFCKELY